LKDFDDEKDFNSTPVSSKEDNNDELMRIEKVIKSIERNNLGVFKFLEVNGMPYDKAKKSIRRVVRLSIRYNE